MFEQTFKLNKTKMVATWKLDFMISLERTLREYFLTNQNGVFTKHPYSFAIIKEGRDYFFFDSHGKYDTDNSPKATLQTMTFMAMIERLKSLTSNEQAQFNMCPIILQKEGIISLVDDSPISDINMLDDEEIIIIENDRPKSDMSDIQPIDGIISLDDDRSKSDESDLTKIPFNMDTVVDVANKGLREVQNT